MADRRRFLVTTLAAVAALSIAPSTTQAQADPDDPSAIPPPPPVDVVVPDDTSDATEEVAVGIPPRSLAIPKLGVEAKVVGVGQDEDGAMAAPSDPDEVAWYNLSRRDALPRAVPNDVSVRRRHLAQCRYRLLSP